MVECVICHRVFRQRRAGQRACSRSCGAKLHSLVCQGLMPASEHNARAKAKERGYGNEHQKLRRSWVPKVASGQVACARCGRLIEPGEPWDLGHHDLDRSIYVGPEHSRCNRATSAHRAKRRGSRRRGPSWWTS